MYVGVFYRVAISFKNDTDSIVTDEDLSTCYGEREKACTVSYIMNPKGKLNGVF